MPRTVSDDFGTVIVDLDGVVYHGNEALPGAGDALATLDAGGWRLVMATNNSSKTPGEVVDKVTRLTGYRPDIAHVVTSSMAAASFLAGTCATALVVGEEALVRAIEDVGIGMVEDWRQAEAVVVGVDFDISYQTMDIAARAIRTGAAFVATNTDATFPMPDGLAVGSGAIVAAIATAAGTHPTVCGKPEKPMRELISQHIIGSDVWVIGDRPETDISMAIKEGWRSILPLTGVTTRAEAGSSSHIPDFIVASIADAPNIITEHAYA
jgi:HAD superfamily hydrolase (TIGR01450 family)